ncbi:hypothetical protein PACTADRAFT_48394 [Pachysolen tannophilus NRRL Y-2460]|uniref:Translation initiation factor IF-2, mitochondrial n=1 Tax=Pachysolen tannophilus NRRL Y-2460 TaxID=669874 RepID=A0A1E4TXS5_PACTA|nr:hypothetical protein PACTADRAFT_48394 [Pachysolen tannophilus NRRL Y-2460]
MRVGIRRAALSRAVQAVRLMELGFLIPKTKVNDGLIAYNGMRFNSSSSSSSSSSLLSNFPKNKKRSSLAKSSKFGSKIRKQDVEVKDEGKKKEQEAPHEIQVENSNDKSKAKMDLSNHTNVNSTKDFKNNRDRRNLKKSSETKKITEEFAKKLEQEQRSKSNKNKNKKKSMELTDLKQKHLNSSSITKIPLAIPTFLTVANLANILKIRMDSLLQKLEELGFNKITYNYILDNETASLIADEYGFEIVVNDDLGADLFPSEQTKDVSLLKPRAPIVTIMGHVDHGKTTILDFLRKSSIVSKEHGGITQHIGAFSVIVPNSGKKITFLDTPGHAAFLKMRERGANITDIVVLVVAADDSVMPQTKEAIKHAKKAGVQIVVAINKCDKPNANPQKVIADLAANGIDVEDYGGEIQTVKVSGKTGLGMEELEEAIVTLADIQELKAQVSKVPVEGWIIESEVKKGLGNVATFLVTKGTLKPGSILVAGKTWCKVKSMKDEFGVTVKSAAPSTPIEVIGWKELPEAGDQAIEAKDELFAKKVVNNRITRDEKIKEAKDIETINQRRLEEQEAQARKEKLQELNKLGLSLEDIKDKNLLDNEQLQEFESLKPKTKIVPYIVKSDVSGSSEAIVESISNLGNEEVKSSVLYSEVGFPTESDIDRAETSGATIICFNLKVPKEISNKASRKNVIIKEHTVIYHLIEDVVEQLTSFLPPKIEIKVLATTEIRATFNITDKNKKVFKIAGCRVQDGVLKRNSKIRVMRNKSPIYVGQLDSLKHEKDEVIEVKKGTECGLSFGKWQDFQEGDIIESYQEVEIKRYL